MKFLNRISAAILIIGALILLARCSVIRVPPGSVGVVNREWTSGFEEKDYPPGYHLDVGPFHNWTVFDTTVQTLHMNNERHDFDEGTSSIEGKSADGATVTLDVSIKYRIKPSEAWKVMKTVGGNQTMAGGYKKLVQDRSNKVLFDAIGDIRTQEFYDPEKREAVQVQMEQALTQELDTIHVELIAVLLRDVRFQASLENQIKIQALAGQKEELNKAETLAEDFKGRTRKIQAQTAAEVRVIDQEREKQLTTMTAENDRKVAAITADFQKRVVEIQSDADLYAAQKEAEATKLLKEAEAQGQTLRREAVATSGGNALVALELASNLNFGDMTVSTQAVNPLDVAEILRLLGLPSK